MPVGEFSRSPCGERGLKYAGISAAVDKAKSLPVRGAWIEIQSFRHSLHLLYCRSPCGERGLKCFPAGALRDFPEVAPRAGSVD